MILPPFIDYEFYKKLETSKCTSMETGWVPEHMVIKRQNELVGVIPNYRKFNSNGEYVFDHIFVNAYNQLGKIFSKISFSNAFHSCQKKKFFLQ